MTDRELLDLLLANRPLIDVRAPVEFSHGSLPGAVNLPLLNDDERAQVGSVYKRKGPEAAVELGQRLISGETKTSRIDTWKKFVKAHPKAIVYCFRGGLRSQSVCQALKTECGLEVQFIPGGYKKARLVLSEKLEALSKEVRLNVITGFTGAGKTEFLRRELMSFEPVCDLEGLAKHRGSAFGKLVSPQPSQSDFENLLTLDLTRSTRKSLKPVWIEDESRMIGKVVVPDALFANLSTSPLYVLERPRAIRAKALIAEYLSENYGLADNEPEPNAEALEKFRLDTENYLELINRRLGGAEYKSILQLFTDAVSEHKKIGSFAAHEIWVDRLLEKYYDPVYLRHLDRESKRVVFNGTASDLLTHLSQKSPIAPSAV